MILFWLLLAAAVSMTAAQDVFPGQSLFHTGWYNVVDAAALVFAALQLRAIRAKLARRAPGELIALAGGAMIVLAGVASGLLGPDTHTVIGLPGATVSDDEIGGSLAFPLAQPNTDPKAITVSFGSTAIGSGRKYTGALVLRQTPRTVVWVSAADANGNSLTITQPTNPLFLSPVLAMQQTTTIAQMSVRYDTFAVPAVRRTVKTVLFDAAQAARLGQQAPPPGTPAILFAQADQSDRAVPHGIGVVASGSAKLIGGLRLGARAGTYPAVVVASAPYLPVLIAGGIVLLAGVLRAVTSLKTAA